MQLQNTTGMDRAQWYETRRNELLKLLERTTGLEIPKGYAKNLADIRKKCLENQFEIVLVAQFQGGKSTTFNTLCDGRDLSPRGLGGGGIKTSAAIISAQNISDGETKNGMDEWAEITFKSKYEIQYGMFDILHEILSEDQNFKNSVIKTGVKEEDYLCKISSPAEFAKILDLDNSTHRKAVRDTLNIWWDQWNANKGSLSSDELDRLRIATLIDRFYNIPEYKELISKTTTGIYDFQSLVAFPTDWAPRWSDGQKASFKLSEIAFIFIARTLLRIKSKNLARVGCRISDCPGLFANAFDTNVTTKAIMHSDAVWYLIGGEKQIGQQDLKALAYIKNMGMADKIVGSVNFRGRHNNIEKNIFPVTKAILKENDLKFPLLPYDARLAFLANQGERLAQHKGLSYNDLYGMKIDSENIDTSPSPAPEEMWISMINDAGVMTGIKSLKGVDDVSEESVALVKEESHIDGIMDFLNKDIISKKSRAILIDSGSQKAADALQEYEGILKTSEDAALQDEKVWRGKVDASNAELEKFVEKSKSIVNRSPLVTEKELLSPLLAKDLISQIIDDKFIEEIGFVIAYTVVVERAKFKLDARGLNDAIFRNVSPKLNMLFKNGTINVLTSWTKQKDICDSWRAFHSRLECIEQEIKELWNADIRKNEYLKDIPFRIFEGTTLEDQLTKVRAKIFDSIEIYNLTRETLLQTFSLGGILGGILQIFQSAETIAANQNQKAKKIAESKTIPKLKKILKSRENQEEISSVLVSTFNQIQDSLKKRIVEFLNGLLVRFQKEHVDPAKRNFSESETKRKEIAEKNHKIRVEQIEPLRREIREFEAQVSNEIDA